MDNLLARERAAQEYVKSLQSHAELPFQITLDAFTAYRTIVQEVALGDIVRAELHEKQLWDQHVETRQLLARTLKELRRKQEEKIVEVRVATEMYLRFLKQSIRFYRNYIYQLSVKYGGIPELERVAHHMKQNSSSEPLTNGEAQSELHSHVLRSCHRSLIYLGDLCRYRASDHLDKQQDFGPAVGFYGLACALIPESGWGFNQQALVAREKKQYLLATYHLYRSLLVAEPSALAKKSLALHFERCNAAWEKGELIQKNAPGDPSAGKEAAIGLFVRLHSMCAGGGRFNGLAELEQELFIRLSGEIRKQSLNHSLVRMVLVNIGAQYTAMENYRELQNAQNEQAFYYFMQINLFFFTSLLQIFREDLLSIAKDFLLVEAELTDKVKPAMVQVLPALRLYSAWLLLNSHLLAGLVSNDFLAPAIEDFWLAYARTLDLVNSCFPIWDLEDAEPVQYLLEEDTEALGYLPLDDAQAPKLVKKLFVDVDLVTQKPYPPNDTTNRATEADEALARIMSILEIGSYVANDLDDSPLYIRGTRFVLGSATAAPFEIPTAPKPEPVKPLSYAAAAAVKATTQTRVLPGVKHRTGQDKASAQTVSEQSIVSQDDAQFSQMVDSLVEEEEADHPVTPPQSWASHPAVVSSQGETFEFSTIASDPKADVDMIRAALSETNPVVPTRQAKSSRKAGFGRHDDVSDFSPRPSRPGSGQLWSPSSPRSTPTSVLQRSARSPLPSPKLLSEPRQQRSGSFNSTISAMPGQDPDVSLSISSLPTHAANQQQDLSPNTRKASKYLRLPTTSTASHKRPDDSPGHASSASLASPLLFGSGSIWSARPASRPGSAG